jgi:sterol 14-demethylase
MGLLEQVTEPLAQQLAQRGTGVVVAAGIAVSLVLAVVLNVLQQLLLKNPNEPPVVFHWFPVVGNTVKYGMDPYGFFFECRAKVCALLQIALKIDSGGLISCVVWRYFHVYIAWEENDGLPGTAGE